jgi:hypothetical protein
MNCVYAVWYSVGAYEGADELLGLYSSEEAAKSARSQYLTENNDVGEDYLYTTRITLNDPCKTFFESIGVIV